MSTAAVLSAMQKKKALTPFWNGRAEKTGCCKSLIVTGCLTQRYQDEVKKEIPEVDAILGTNSYDSIVEALEETLQHKFYKNFHTLSGLPQLSTKRTVTTGGHYAYLKIAEGCNKTAPTV